MTLPLSFAEVDLWERADGWFEAVPRGKSAPILRPVPGNTAPAHAARWRHRGEALAELCELLDVRVVSSHTYWYNGNFDAADVVCEGCHTGLLIFVQTGKVGDSAARLYRCNHCGIIVEKQYGT